jgi:hypothetical protein
MLGRIIVRDEMIILEDEPVIDVDAARKNNREVLKAVHNHGISRILVRGAVHAEPFPLDLAESVCREFAEGLPPGARVAFLHRDNPEIRPIAEAVCELMGGFGVGAIPASSESAAQAWVFSDLS